MTLSDKILYAEDYASESNIGRLLTLKDVKEFIKELKDKIGLMTWSDDIDYIEMKDLIDKLAGDKLI